MKLNIFSFGKFKNISFELSDITVFFGKNESGKTTIFDALLSVLSKHDNTKVSGVVKKRYDKETDVLLEPKIESEKLPMDAYINLYAVRQSDVVFNIGDNKAWQKTIRRVLYGSEIDIDSIIDDIKVDLSSKAQGRIGGEKALLQKEHEKIKNECESLYKEEENLDSETSLVNEEMKNIAHKKAEFEKEKKNLLDFEKIISVEETVLRRKRYIKILEDIKAYKKAEEYVVKNKAYSEDKSEDIRNIATDIETKRKHIAMLQNMKGQYALRDESTLYKIDSALEYIKKCRKSFPYLKISAILISVISVCIFAFTKNPVWFFGLFSIFLLFIKNGGQSERNVIKNVCMTISELDFDPTKIKSIDKTLELLIVAKNDFVKSKENLQDIEEEIEYLRNSIEETEKFFNQVKREHGFSNIEEYFENAQNYKGHVFERDRLRKIIDDYLFSFSFTNINMLETETERILKEIEREGVPYTNVSEEDIAVKKNEYKKMRMQIDEKEKMIVSGEASVLAKSSFMQGKFVNLPKEIVLREGRLSEIERRISEIEERESSLLILKEIFANMKEKNDSAFIDLWKDTALMFSQITNKSGRKADVKELSSDFIYLSDDFGMRHIEHASSATKTLFLFLLRLTLISKLGNKDFFILLDDPFVTFDEERITNMIEFMKGYIKEFGIKIVFFTKDKLLSEKLALSFDNVVKHDI